MFTSRIGAFREVSTMNLRVSLCRLSLYFHFSALFAATAEPHAFLASDFTPRVKERIAAEIRVRHDLRLVLARGCHLIWYVGEDNQVMERGRYDRRRAA
jgi:hypothetical protein